MGNILANPTRWRPARFVASAAALTKKSAEVITIDGKTVRRPFRRRGREPIQSSGPSPHASAWCWTDEGRREVDKIVAIRRVELLAIEGAVVSSTLRVASETAPTIMDMVRPISG